MVDGDVGCSCSCRRDDGRHGRSTKRTAASGHALRHRRGGWDRLSNRILEAVTVEADWAHRERESVYSMTQDIAQTVDVDG